MTKQHANIRFFDMETILGVVDGARYTSKTRDKAHALVRYLNSKIDPDWVVVEHGECANVLMARFPQLAGAREERGRMYEAASKPVYTELGLDTMDDMGTQIIQRVATNFLKIMIARHGQGLLIRPIEPPERRSWGEENAIRKFRREMFGLSWTPGQR